MTRFILRFPCGAIMSVTHSPAEHNKQDGHGWNRDKKGRYRVCVYDSDTSFQRPQLDGKSAPCRFSCPCKQKAGRKEHQCFPEDYEREHKPGGKYEGKTFPSISRKVVTCHIASIEATGAPDAQPAPLSGVAWKAWCCAAEYGEHTPDCPNYKPTPPAEKGD